MIQNMVSKLSILGAKILQHNPFCVIFELDGELKLIRLIHKRGKTITKEESEFNHYEMNDYFVLITNRGRIKGLYTAYSQSSITQSKIGKIASFDQESGLAVRGLEGNSKLILFKNTADKLYIMNYKGRKLDITECNEKYDIIKKKTQDRPYNGEVSLHLGMVYNRLMDRYGIGYGLVSYENPRDITSKLVKRIDHLLFTTDSELNIDIC